MTPLDIAITQVGKQENPLGSNWGHPVQDYLASVGIGFPASWCMAFMYWCHNEYYKSVSKANPLPRTGGVLAMWQRVPKAMKAAVPQTGSIFIMDFGHGLGHTGIVEKVDGTVLHTIEGNTNDTGSREGIEVCRKIRDTTNKLIIGYINPPL